MGFFTNLLDVKGARAIAGLKTAVIKSNVDDSSEAELLTQEQELDHANKIIQGLQNELSDEEKKYNLTNGQYTQQLNVATVLESQLADSNISDEKRTSLQASLDNVVSKLEALKPELDSEKNSMDSTQSLLIDANAAFKEKAVALKGARQKLEDAKHELQHVAILEERSEKHAEDAAVIAGIRKSNGVNGVTTALDVMHKAAQEARDRVAENERKASVLKKEPSLDAEDPNIKAALAQVSGTPSQSVSDRLAALRR